MAEQPNIVTQAIARRREQDAQGIKSDAPSLEAYVNEIAEAIKDSNKRLAKMTHAECLAQLRRNASSKIE